MFDIDDRLLMRCTLAPSNESLGFKRHVGDLASTLVGFLPWRVPLGLVLRGSEISSKFLVCYELPNGTVSSRPEISAEAMRRVCADAEQLLTNLCVDPAKLTMVGLSLGSGPATYLANKYGCRLVSVVSADRGDDMLWESPAVATVKEKAQAQGFELAHFRQALAGLHPVENLAGIGAGSVFVTSTQDLYVPDTRSHALMSAVAQHRPDAQIVVSHTGHARTISNALRDIDTIALRAA